MNPKTIRTSWSAPIGCAILTLLLGAALAPGQVAEVKKVYLEQHFGGLRVSFGKKNHDKVQLLSGPEEVKMLRKQSPGKVWQASLNGVKFKITIEDKLQIDAAACVGRIEQLPPAYRRAFQIVSEDKKDGVSFYQDLDGAAAHGSQDYLNLVKDANACVIAHESGHILEQRASRSEPKTLEQWREAITQDKVSVSGYGDGASHEDLAEFACVYALCLDAGKAHLAELKKLSPQRYRLWEKILQPDHK